MTFIVTDDKLQEMRDNLKGRPSCFKIYCEVMTKQDGVLKGFDILVDSWPDCRAVVTKPNPETMEFQFLNSIYNVGGDVSTAIKMLEDPNVVDWKKNITFACMEETLSSAVKEAIVRHGGKVDPSEPCLMLSVTREQLNLIPIPEGLNIRSLTPDDSDLVNSLWKYTTGDESHSYIKTLLSSMTSCGLCDEQGNVRGFAMSYHYGALGVLHVLEEYRGNGYGKVIMSHLANERLKSGREAFVFIEENNVRSLKLHEGLGFKAVPETKVCWITNVPTGCCTTKKKCCV